MRWLKEHNRLTAVLATLLVLIVVVLVSWRTAGEDHVVGRVAGKIVSTVQAPITLAGNFLSEQIGGIFVSGDLAEENEALKEQVRELEKELIRQQLSRADLDELQRLSRLLSYSGVAEDQRLVTADVIALDGSSGFHIFTVNAGTNDGVDIDSVVINGDGLIGRVMSVGSTWATVVSIIDESNSVGFQIQRDLNLLGLCSGDGAGGLSGTMLDDEATVREGDQIITSGVGEIYPAGLIIGKVTSVEWTHDSPLKRVDIEPEVNFKNIKKVTVLI